MTLLNEADAIYLGGAAADKVYLGSNLVWSGAAPPLVAPVFRAKENTPYYNGGVTGVTVSKPAGTVENDILLASLFCGRGSSDFGPITAPAGFTSLGVTNVMQASFYGRFEVWWKRAGASELASYVWDHATHTTNDQVYIAAYSGCPISGSPIDVFQPTARTGLGPQVGVAAGVTTTQANDKLIWLGHNWDASGTLNPPAGMTERYDHLTYSADETIAVAGPTGDRTQTQESTNPWAAFLIALKGA